MNKVKNTAIISLPMLERSAVVTLVLQLFYRGKQSV